MSANRPPSVIGPETRQARRLPVGAEVVPGGGVHFRVWAPRHRSVEVVLEGGPGGDGSRSRSNRTEGGMAISPAPRPPRRRGRAIASGSAAASRCCADPASRFQPEGPHGPSQVVDPSAFAWTDRDWRGPASVDGQVIYELHVGTFTPEGTWAAGRGAAARTSPTSASRCSR